MKISLKLLLINLFIGLVNFLVNSAIWSQNVAHDMTPAVVFLFVGFLFLVNFTFFLGLKTDKNSLYFWPFVGCILPSLLGVFILVMPFSSTIDGLCHIELTMVLTNLILGFFPFFVLVQYHRRKRLAN